jgi:integrase
VSVYKPSDSKYYYYCFEHDGQRYKASTRTPNKRLAEQIQIAKKNQLLMGKAGLIRKEPAPSLREFRERFMEEVEKHTEKHPNTYDFYSGYYNRLLAFHKIADRRLDQIDEHLTSQFQTYELKIQKVRPATVNRGVATLRKAMRLAKRWKLIDVLPEFHMLPEERERKFVFTPEKKRAWLEQAPFPLNMASEFAWESGLCSGEMCDLLKTSVHLAEERDENGLWGYLDVLQGKRKVRERSVPISDRMREILLEMMEQSQGPYIFYGPQDRERKKKLEPNTISHQATRLRRKLNWPWDCVLHATRHTALTELGLSGASEFEIKEAAGHNQIQTSAKYIHPMPESIRRAFARKKAYADQEERRSLGKKPVLRISPRVGETRTGKSSNVVGSKGDGY